MRPRRWPGGATWLAVATANEAAELRRDGVGERILVMGALTRAELELALEADADIVAWREGFARAAAAVASPDRPARLHVKLDTGMGRLGTRDPEEAMRVAALAQSTRGLAVAGLMTHFATADDPESALLRRAAEPFQAGRRGVQARVSRMRRACRQQRRGAAQQAMRTSTWRAAGSRSTEWIRSASTRSAHGLEPALSLRSYVADVKEVRAGDTVGYGRTWSAPAATHVAVLPIGYGDGYRRGLSNSAEVLIRGRRRPVVGTVSMDNITVDVGSDTDVQRGDEAVLIGTQGDERVTAEELARILGTINYEVTCGISSRVPRVAGTAPSPS